MKYYYLKTLFFIFPLFSLSQSSYNLGWSTNGESINQQLTIDVGDTVIWEWTYGTHNLVQVGDVTEPEFGEGYHSTGHQYSHTFTTPGVHDYLCSPHPSTMYGAITVNQPTASVDANLKLNFSIYPNPVDSFVNISSRMAGNEVEVEIYDLMGRLNISKTQVASNLMSMDVSQLSQGLYYIKLKMDDQQQSRKFIKL